MTLFASFPYTAQKLGKKLTFKTVCCWLPLIAR